MFKVVDYIIYRRDLCQLKSIELNPKTNEEYYSLTPIKDEFYL